MMMCRQAAPHIWFNLRCPANIPGHLSARILVLFEGLRPSNSPTRALARRFVGALPPPLKLRRDLAEAPLARRRADRVARSPCSLALPIFVYRARFGL